MKKLALLFILALWIGLPPAYADIIPLDQTSATYLGYIFPGVPANAPDEAGYINGLLNGSAYQVANHTYTRSGNMLTDVFPLAAVECGKGGNGPAVGDPVGCTYLIVKYDGDNGPDMVFYVKDLGGHDYTVPQIETITDPNKSLNHWKYFNPQGTSVPDSGMTVMLLGGVLVGLEALRRRFSA